MMTKLFKNGALLLAGYFLGCLTFMALDAYHQQDTGGENVADVAPAAGGPITKQQAESHYGLGELLVESDPRAAASHMLTAAKAGHADAQYQLAMMYVTGQGVVNNQQEAIKWMESSAKGGNSEAQYMLYRANSDKAIANTQENKPVALAWLTLAAAGNPRYNAELAEYQASATDTEKTQAGKMSATLEKEMFNTND